MPHNHDPFTPSAAVKAVSGKAADKSDEAPQPAPAPELQQAEGQQAEAPVQESNGVPAGTTSEVLDWVGDDQAKAQQALDAEQSSSEPRKSLIKKLQEKLG